ncbi:1-phosphofructokinase family hexose kinase [Rhodoferax aquaticus]|uniref:Phosphofructokinase n=1 Tax=Rhodoferax aquaticus TaxID=2527691 RepID=A0A515EN59_9BURK|nr:1-phosphofructokinase family hexose kinase [Rhodoferax aquaticus]QDL54096.1 1-phosphofructokinase family hexose kinase [Rhodoferax aquaticus]
MPHVLTITMNPALDVSASTAKVEHTRKLRCQQVQRHPGGGGINVARVLHRLGVDCGALFPVGGSTGQLLTQLLDAEGVPCWPVQVAGHIRESFTVRDEHSGQEFRFVLPGPALGELEQQACLSQLRSLTPSPLYVVASGSLPPGVPDSFYAELAPIAAQMGAKLVVDSSGLALSAALRKGVFMLKPSLGEMRMLASEPLPTMAAVVDCAQRWIALGRVQVLAVSMGEMGALLVTAQGAWFAPPLKVKVVSAVGAGDSFVAGMVSALVHSDDLVHAFKMGVACASAALAQAGTSLCDPPQVQRLFAEVLCMQTLPQYSI